jgi:2-methylcitrate dehydratase PrpD
MNETRTLAKFVADTRFADLPDDVVEHMKHFALDHFGVALYSSKTEWGRIAYKYAKKFSCVGECTVYGEEWKTSAQHAALANGLAAHGYELDDSFEGGYCHLGAPTIPAALAVAEEQQRSGTDFLLGAVVGYEVMARISLALGLAWNKFHHATGQAGVFGSTAAASKMMDLDAAHVTDAFGVAGGMASGIMEFANDPLGTMVKRLYGGWPSQSGVVAAWLAGEGLTGPATVIEGRQGFLRGVSPNVDLEPITAGLGKNYEMLRTVLKPYATCRALHPLIEGIAELRTKHGITPEQIKQLDVGVQEKVVSQQMVYEPKSIMSAQYSMPFAAALALSRDLTDPRSVDEACLTDTALLATARKMKAHLDPEMNAFPRYAARIKASLTNGEEVNVTTYDHKGTPAKPFTFEEMAARFRLMTAGIVTPRSAENIIAAVDSLDGKAHSLEVLTTSLRNVNA